MKLKYLKHTDALDFFAVDKDTFASIPMFSNAVQAGFPSPAEDHMDMDLNLNDYLVENPSATFCVKAIGESMKDAGIHSGDIMIVDKSLEPKNRSIILAVINGEFTVKRVNINDGSLYLLPENSSFSPIKITQEMDFHVWGVVTYIIHKAV
jgi:DNA polymerase V